MNPQEEIDRTRNVTDMLAKHEPLTPSDVQLLRENTFVARSLTSYPDPVGWRMDIELLDAIRKLDESSTRLSRVGNRLTLVGVVATILGVLIAIYALVR